MKAIHKKIISVILLLAFCVGSFITVTYVSRVCISESNQHLKINFNQFYKQEKNSIDVVFLGSSAVYRDYISTENWNNYCFTSYLLTTMSQSFSASKYLIEEAEKTQNPTLYVIEVRQLVTEILRETEGTQTDEDEVKENNRFLANCMKFSKNRYDLIKEILPDDIVYSNLDFIRNHDVWNRMLPKTFFKNLFAKFTYKEYISSGCVNVISKWTPYDKPEIDTDGTCTISEQRIDKLNSVIDYIKENNINVLFISTPYVESEKSRIIENSIGEYLSDMGCDYINMNEYYDEIGIDFSTDFYDVKHTNILGAQKVTAFIGKYISENYEFGSEHANDVIDDWNSSYEVWTGVAERLKAETKENIKKDNRCSE